MGVDAADYNRDGWLDIVKTNFDNDIPSLYKNEGEGFFSDVTFHAGLELSVLHLGLWVLTWPVRWGWVASLAPLTGALAWVARRLEPFGGDRGAMFVELTGRDEAGRIRRARWTLVARSGHGPCVPVTPAVLLAGRLARGEIDRRGATPCLDLFTLEEAAAALADLDIDFDLEEGLCVT